MSQNPNPYDVNDPQASGQPYGAQDAQQPPAYGQQSHGGYPQHPGQPYAPTTPKRSTAATVVGIIFAVLAGLFGLMALLNLATNSPFSRGGGYVVGWLLGMLLLVGIPALIAYLCLTSHRRKAKRQLP